MSIEIPQARIDYEHIRKYREKLKAQGVSTPKESLPKREVTVRLIENFRKEITARGHRLVSDEPEYIGGSNQGPRPTELMLSALGSCLLSIMVIYASTMRLRLDGAECRLRGDLNPMGLLGQEGIRVGLDNIHVEIHIASPEPAERIRRLVENVVAHCPVTDNIANPTPMQRLVLLNGQPIGSPF